MAADPQSRAGPADAVTAEPCERDTPRAAAENLPGPGTLTSRRCPVQKGEACRVNRFNPLAELMRHRPSPPGARSADTRRNSEQSTVNGTNAASSRTSRLGLPAAARTMAGSRRAPGAGQRPTARVTRPGWFPVRSGRSGPGPKDEDHQPDRRSQARWSRRAGRWPRRPHAAANRVPACGARQKR